MTDAGTRILVHRWGRRFVVSVEPRRIDRPSRVFETERQALEFSERLTWSEGWPIENQLEAVDNGPRAA